MVTDYVGTELVPAFVEVFRLETDEWGFPWHREWTSYRQEDPKRLSIALVDGQTWFHGAATRGGHSGISIGVSVGANAPFATLTDGLVSTFTHELFHNLQRSSSLHYGGDGRVDGTENAWQFFSEGTAVLAESVGQPQGQFTQTLPARTYMSVANAFLRWGGERDGSLNAVDEIDPYQSAIYWRFLYERCGGTSDHPSAGMQVIRRALDVLYSGEVVDILSSTDLVGAAPQVIERAFVGSTCPFQSFDESWLAFARALYELSLEGECAEPCGLYDPFDQYNEPPVSTITYTGAEQVYPNSIRNRFGIDLVDVVIDPSVGEHPLTIEFCVDPGSRAEFGVQLVPVTDVGQDTEAQPGPIEMEGIVLESQTNPDGCRIFTLPATYSKVGLVVTRLDTGKDPDLLGEYTIRLSAVGKG
jgi:hypothetical protein